MTKKFLIKIQVNSGAVLRFTVSNYEVTHGTRIKFLDEKTKIIKEFDSRNCEIEEVPENEQ